MMSSKGILSFCVSQLPLPAMMIVLAAMVQYAATNLLWARYPLFVLATITDKLR